MRIIFFLLAAFVCTNSIAQTADQHIYTGNKLYAKGQYKAAAAEYQKAYQDKKNREAQYNLGNAFYQQKDYEKANKQYTETASNSKDKNLRAASNHNIGNTYMEQKKWDEAIQNYKQSLKQNPDSKETKYNLAYAQAMKKKQENDDKNKKDQNKDKDKQDQNKKDQQDKQDKDKQDKGKQDPKQDDKQDPKEPKDKEQDKPQSQPSKLTKDQADQLLNALNQEEKKLREKKDKERGQAVKLEKDW